jgi:UDP-N-acetylglucosamine 2-epimerase
MLVVGARPQIIKSAPIIHEVEKHKEIDLQLVHTGQHYDFEMSRIFFNEMDLPDPLINLGVGSGTQAWQTGNIMIKLEKVMMEKKPDCVIVPGDTNSTLAGALVAVKLHVPMAHVEAGARSYNMRMPEEINRRLTDHCSSLLFAPTRNCAANLEKEGILRKCVRLSGDTMYDALIEHRPIVAQSTILKKLGLKREEYSVLTIHRPENVDAPEKLDSIIRGILILKELTVVFPIHPRTKQRLVKSRLKKQIENSDNVKLVEPVGYHDMLKLTENAKLVFTDSGGLQKEAFWLHTPCVTLRDETEWIETVRLGANTLIGNDTKKLIRTAKEIAEAENIKSRLGKLKNPFGDGHAAQRIVSETLKMS